jgi:hypothetical protein
MVLNVPLDEAAARGFGAVISDLRDMRMALLPESNRDLNNVSYG